MAIRVNMFHWRVTSEVQPRSKNGAPAQSTTGVARISSSHSRPRSDNTPVAEAGKRGARHGHQQKRDGDGYAEPETPGHGNQFVVGRFLGRDGARLERHSADGAASSSRGDDFGMHRAGVSSGRGAC